MELNRPSSQLELGALALSYEGENGGAATSGRSAGERRLPARRSSMSYFTRGSALVTFLIAARSVEGLMPIAVAWPANGPASSTISLWVSDALPRASATRRSVCSSGTASATTIVGG